MERKRENVRISGSGCGGDGVVKEESLSMTLERTVIRKRMINDNHSIVYVERNWRYSF
jgi:hypothetical protein